MVRARDLGAVIMGAMARVPVPGTPKAHLGQISEEKLARIIAVSRLVGGEVAQEICVHPPSDAAVAAGANAVVVETGAVPASARRSRGRGAVSPWPRRNSCSVGTILCGRRLIRGGSDMPAGWVFSWHRLVAGPRR